MYICVFFKKKTAYDMRISYWKFRRVLFRSITNHSCLIRANECVCVAGPLLKLPNEFGAGLVPEKGPRPLPAAWECDLNGDVLTWAPGVFDLFGLPRGCPISRCDTSAMYAPESRARLDRFRINDRPSCRATVCRYVYTLVLTET